MTCVGGVFTCNSSSITGCLRILAKFIFSNHFGCVAQLTGPLVFAVIMLFDSSQTLMPEQAWRVFAVASWMAIWWATEAIAVAATALLPMVLLPLVGVMSLSQASAAYASPTIYLFLGAFILAAGVERWSLHKRLALRLLAMTGTEGRTLIGSLMLVAALLSMWMTNTSTTMMLLPIVLSIAGVIMDANKHLSDAEKTRFQVAILLGLAYAASIGGLATIIGTPPNVLLVAFLAENYEITIGFADWMLIGVPLVALLLPTAWWLLTHVFYPVNIPQHAEVTEQLNDMRQALGKTTPAEKRVAIIFCSVALLWMLRQPLSSALGWEFLTDTFIALGGGVLLFVTPSGDTQQSKLIVWNDLRYLPWGVLLLFGGGLSLAAAVSSSGLAQWLGEALAPLGSFGIVTLVIGAAAMVIFLTELTSNVATAATFLPVVAAIAVEMGLSPVVLAVPVALASSCAFMLPVATAPNAIVFSAGVLTVPHMVKVGVMLNLVGIALISAASLWWVPILFTPAS